LSLEEEEEQEEEEEETGDGRFLGLDASRLSSNQGGRAHPRARIEEANRVVDILVVD
jgi:hypothetical protein